MNYRVHRQQHLSEGGNGKDGALRLPVRAHTTCGSTQPSWNVPESAAVSSTSLPSSEPIETVLDLGMLMCHHITLHSARMSTGRTIRLSVNVARSPSCYEMSYVELTGREIIVQRVQPRRVRHCSSQHNSPVLLVSPHGQRCSGVHCLREVTLVTSTRGHIEVEYLCRLWPCIGRKTSALPIYEDTASRALHRFQDQARLPGWCPVRHDTYQDTKMSDSHEVSDVE